MSVSGHCKICQAERLDDAGECPGCGAWSMNLLPLKALSVLAMAAITLMIGYAIIHPPTYFDAGHWVMVGAFWLATIAVGSLLIWATPKRMWYSKIGGPL